MAVASPQGRYDQRSDFYQSFRFMVMDTGDFIQSQPTAGFSNCTLPEHNVEPIHYSEGTWTYERVFPGRSTFSSVTLSRGVVAGDTRFANWILAAAEGKNYRTDITIVHFHRADISGMTPEFNLTVAKQSRLIVMKNCMPLRFRPGHDFDATASDISIAEIEFQPESFKVFQGDPGTTVQVT
jgi:phage tail-like protein